ncbi:MAG: hypothetical protein KGO94_03805 [Alphaproteobacteria bacterium]|nr:hypothetical protein [Alphaproteobacteria bacterium]
MGINGKAIYSATEFAAHSVPGHMWMELFQGPHVSTDCAVVAGRAVWFRHAEGMRWHEGMFKHWVIYAKPLLELEDFLRHWVEKHMAGYTGMMNFETIGGHIIEAHLRFADQWVDLYGVGWVHALVNLYAEGKWTFKPGNEVEGYSIPLFAKPHARLLQPPAQVQAEIRCLPHVRSLQITFHEMKDVSQHPMPPGGFRLGIINADVLQAGFFARRKLAEAFAGIEIMLPE